MGTTTPPTPRRRRSDRGFGKAPRFVPVDTLDIGCPTCGGTYTAYETHDCPGYNLWAPRPKLRVVA